MKHRYARVYNNIVTHLVQAQTEWINLNPWLDVPGEWIECGEPVNCEWQYDAATQTFSPPANK